MPGATASAVHPLQRFARRLTVGEKATGPIRLVALDIDGTVLLPDGSIAPSTVAAVTAARRAGVRVVLASSRGPVALERIADALHLRREWFVGYQGALVARERGKTLEVLHDTRIESAAAREVEDRAVASRLSVGRYVGSRWLVRELTDAIRHEATTTGERPTLSTPEEADADAPPHKLMVVADGEAHPCALEELAGALPDTVTATLSHPSCLEVTAAGVDKGSGIRPLAERLGIPVEAIAAVGDGRNDIGLFGSVGHPVAMGQSAPEVRAAASWVTSSVTEDGVARALHHLGVLGGRR